MIDLLRIRRLKLLQFKTKKLYFYECRRFCVGAFLFCQTFFATGKLFCQAFLKSLRFQGRALVDFRRSRNSFALPKRRKGEILTVYGQNEGNPRRGFSFLKTICFFCGVGLRASTPFSFGTFRLGEKYQKPPERDFPFQTFPFRRDADEGLNPSTKLYTYGHFRGTANMQSIKKTFSFYKTKMS